MKLPKPPPARVPLVALVGTVAAAAIAWGSQSRWGVAMEVVVVAALVLAVSVGLFVRHGIWLVALAQGRALFEPYGPYRSMASLLPAPLVTGIVVGVPAVLAAVVLEWGVRPRVPALALAGAAAAVVAAARFRRDSVTPQGVFHGTLRAWLPEGVAAVVVLTTLWNVLYFLLRYGPLTRVGGEGFGRHSAVLLIGGGLFSFSWCLLRAACEQRGGTLALTDRPGRPLVRRALLAITAMVAVGVVLVVVKLPHVGWWPGFIGTSLAALACSAVGSVAGVVVGTGLVAPNPWKPDEQRR